jgi:hypothetical protein
MMEMFKKMPKYREDLNQGIRERLRKK